MFIGRERELANLNKLYKSDKFEFAVIYGRRRVGKTALINEFIKGKPSICFTGVETNAKQNLENFSNCILEYASGINANMTHGLKAGALIVIAARPGMGKTSLAMNLVEHASLRAGKTCAVFSLEMPRSEIVQRLICSYANVSMQRALDGALTAKEWKKLMLAGDQLKKSNIFIDDSSRVTPAEILSKCRRLKTTAGGVDLIMIDYIQLMSSGDSKMAGGENRQQEIASITRDLKIMAKELGVPVIALSQLRRIQSKEPQLSDLRESGAIEQDADIVMFISRPEAIATAEELASGKIVKGAAELILAKHRGGEQGRVSLKFIGECTKFVDVDEQNRDDEPPEYARAVPTIMDDDDEEYVAPDDDYMPPEPPMRKSDLKSMDDDELPFD